MDLRSLFEYELVLFCLNVWAVFVCHVCWFGTIRVGSKINRYLPLLWLWFWFCYSSVSWLFPNYSEISTHVFSVGRKYSKDYFWLKTPQLKTIKQWRPFTAIEFIKLWWSDKYWYIYDQHLQHKYSRCGTNIGASNKSDGRGVASVTGSRPATFFTPASKFKQFI